jgi:multidrug efflux pump subunit AcrA (membrane-fusion protein)
VDQRVGVLNFKKLLYLISALILISLGLWWGSMLLSNKNKVAEVEELVSEIEMNPEVSGQQILISSKQIEQVGIQLHTLGFSSNDVQKQIILQGQAQWSPESKVVLTSPISGIVQQVLVQPLTAVTRNHHVLAVHSPDLIQIQNEVLQIRAQQQLAQQNLTRERSLYAEGIIAEKRVQEAQNQLQRLNIDLGAKQRMLQFMGGGQVNSLNPVVYVKSPASGYVENLQVSTGQYVEAGAVVGQLVNEDSPLQLLLQANLADSKYLHIGDVVQVEGCDITGRVQNIAPALVGNTQTQNIIVQMDTKHNCLRVQQFVKVHVQSKQSTAISAWPVPSTAITSQDGKHIIFVKNQKGFEAVTVEILSADQQQSYITAEKLNPKMQLAISGVERLKAVWSGFGAEQAPVSTTER